MSQYSGELTYYGTYYMTAHFVGNIRCSKNLSLMVYVPGQLHIKSDKYSQDRIYSKTVQRENSDYQLIN